MNNAKICVSVCAETADEMIEKIRRAEEHADVIEVRFDCLANGDFRSLFERLPETKKTYLFTFRPREQGGRRDLTLGERLKFWEHVLWARKDGFLVDLEFEPSLLSAVNPSNIDRIVSFHDFDGSPEHLNARWEMMSEISGTTTKIAVQTGDIRHAIAVWKLLDLAKARNKQIIPIAMGEAGKWTRILGPAHGAFMTYAALDKGGETAPGQITAEDLIETFRVRHLDQETKVFGVIGDPVSQSLSTYMHNPAFVSRGINAVFIPFLVKDIDAFMRRMVRPETREVELNFGGFSVTMPHKQSIMRHLDAIDATAEKIGAVNTVKIENGKLTGYNTDAYGFITPLKAKFGDLAGSRVAVFGAGGAARACVYALKQENARVTVFARDEKKARAFAVEFGVDWKGISNLKSQISNLVLSDFDILVDTTPLGMSGQFEHDSLFTAEQLKGIKFVYDLVTKPYDTPIIREAKKAGIPAIGGLEMLVAQGAMQFEIWTGQNAPIEMMTESVFARINKIQK